MGKLKEYIFRIKSLVRWTKKFITHDIWEFNFSELSKARARIVRDLQVVIVALKTFSEEKIGFQSVALSYFCTMAAVPLIAVSFAVTSGFGLEGKLLEALYAANFDQRLIDMLMKAADNIIKAARSGLFGLVSALSFVWLVLWMMNRVEKVFNNVWKVRKPKRKAFKSYGIDIIIMLLIPFVVLIFFAGTVVYSHVLDLIPNSSGITDSIKPFFGWLIFTGVSVLTLSAMYKFIPATYVDYKCALKAAMLAGIAFALLQYSYLETQVFVTNINAVYGAVAALPLFMIWLRYGWMIILYGAQFSYSIQTVEAMDAGKAAGGVD